MPKITIILLIVSLGLFVVAKELQKEKRQEVNKLIIKSRNEKLSDFEFSKLSHADKLTVLNNYK